LSNDLCIEKNFNAVWRQKDKANSQVIYQQFLTLSLYYMANYITMLIDCQGFPPKINSKIKKLTAKGA